MLIADLSNNNNQGNLPPLVRAIKRAGFVGVIFKISQGAHFVDSRAKAGIAEARAVGLKVGGYHFADEGDVVTEAMHFIRCAHAAGLWKRGDIRPQLDFEWPCSTAHASPWRDGFFATVAAHAGGAHCAMYTAPGFNPKWLPVKRGGKLLRLNRRLWVADYGGFAVPNGYKLSDVWLHQYTASYAIPGHGKIDASRVLGRVPRLTLAQNCLAKAC
jgi:GH25 family lysozyme M1 (1,4-beta-N-acetylmuramidase)